MCAFDAKIGVFSALPIGLSAYAETNKIFLFFPDFVVRYVRFWSRIFAYFNAPLEDRRHVSNGVNG